jgi:hypothetical protein
MLNLTSLVKVKDAASLVVHAVAAILSLMSSAQEAVEDVPLMAEVVEAAVVTPFLMDVDTITPAKIMIVRMQMLKIMQDFQVYKFSEEVQAVDASVELLTQDNHLVPQHSASSTLALEVDHLRKFKFKLERIK